MNQPKFKVGDRVEILKPNLSVLKGRDIYKFGRWKDVPMERRNPPQFGTIACVLDASSDSPFGGYHVAWEGWYHLGLQFYPEGCFRAAPDAVTA
jgi:hypothetical protein